MNRAAQVLRTPAVRHVCDHFRDELAGAPPQDLRAQNPVGPGVGHYLCESIGRIIRERAAIGGKVEPAHVYGDRPGLRCVLAKPLPRICAPRIRSVPASATIFANPSAESFAK